MKIWSMQNAKARFSEFVATCLADGPQMVTKRGAKAAVLVSVAEWQRLVAPARPLLKDLLLSDVGRTETLTAPRGSARSRRKVALR